MPLSTGLALDTFFKNHDTGDSHPESPARIGAVQAELAFDGLLDQLTPLTSNAATDADVRLVHSTNYVHLVRDDVRFGTGMLSTGDTPLSDHSLEVALKATGAVLGAVDDVIAGKVKNAFCAVRPPGHHATPTRGMGFCIFNHIAIAARHARQRHKMHKVLIVDFDVHHGNGTQDAFYHDGSVMFFSSHQSPWYPGTGKRDETGTGKGLGCVINAPLPAGAGRDEVLGEMETRLLPAVQQFKPELVLVSAGFDSRHGDPLGDFTLTDQDFYDITRMLMAIAHDHCGDRLVSVMEGGYNLDGLARGVRAHVKALAGLQF